MKNKKGISLIVLVITIIVMVILAAAIILTLNNTGIINKSSEAVFKQNVKNYQSELSLYLADRLASNSKFNVTTVNATNITTPSITDIISSIRDEDIAKFEIASGELKYVGDNELELTWCEELGLRTKNSPLTEAEYNALYATEIAQALKYGVVEGSKYTTTLGYYNADTEGWIDNVLATPYGVTEVVVDWPGGPLEEVVFAPTVESIDLLSDSVSKIDIPASVTALSIETSSDNVTLTVNSNNEIYVGQDNVLYNKVNNTIEFVPVNLSGDITILDGITTINDCAFQGRKITSVVLPDSVTVIGEEAFDYCVNLKRVELSKNLETIKQRAFYGTEIESITIPSTVKLISYYAFAYCKNLTTVNIEEGVIGLNGDTFMGCTALTKIVLPSTITTLMVDDFSGCTSLKEIYVEAESLTLEKCGIFDGVTATMYVRNNTVYNYMIEFLDGGYTTGNITVSTDYNWTAPTE